MNRRATLLLSIIVFGAALQASEEFGFRAKYVRTVDANARTIVATRCDQAPKFDGTLNDPIWAKAGRTPSAFTNFPATEACGRQTIVFCCYDQNALYVAFDCEEPELDQQQIDNKDVLASDHIGVHLEVGDTRGRGARCFVMGNRANITYGGAWNGAPNLPHECKAGPNRWYYQLAIPFKSLIGVQGAPLSGEVWGVKFTRYGKNSETGASRMRSCWPHIPTIVEDVVTYNANLCFGAESMLQNSALAGKGNEIDGWKAVSGQVEAGDGKLKADGGVTLRQEIVLRAGSHYAMEWTGGENFKGDVTVIAGDKSLEAQDLSKSHRVDFVLPKGVSNAAVVIKLTGSGAPPTLRMNPVLDDVPANWICLTNNDWIPERNLKNRVPGSADGVYTYLKTQLHGFGRAAPYKSLGCPNPDAKELQEPWGYFGRPIRKPLDAPPPRPDVGEEEFESFPFAVIYSDGCVPEFCGLPSGSFDAGGEQGWIPFSKGSLTGDPSWAGWPVDRWSSAEAHDLVFDFKDKYYIRRIDIQQINTGVRNLEIQVRGTANPAEGFATVYRFNGPGTERNLQSIIPVYFSQSGIDSVAQQLRLSLGNAGAWGNGAAVSYPNLGRPNCQVGLFGISEIWVWAEPKGAHADNEIKVFKPFVPNEQPPLKFAQLQKLPEPVIWPRPKELVKGDGRFEIKAATSIVTANAGQLPDLAQWLKSEIKDRFCADLAVKNDDAAAGENIICLGIKGSNAAFDALCAKEGAETGSSEQQSYVLKITPSRVLIAGNDIEGAAHGLRTLLQWIEHDETTAFARTVSIRDWPLLKFRTVVPSADHRRPLLPTVSNPSNYYKIINGISYLRFNSVLDWLPTVVCENEDKTRELIHFAANRFTDVRPALWVQRVPGDCIEANPDDQPDGGAGIGNSDGTWESDNLCPSNPKSYKAIEDFLDAALRTHDTSRYVDVGFMGCVGKNWNVCRLCRRRGLSGFELYGDFVNKVNAICHARNRAAIFTNGIMFSDAIKRASGGKDPETAFDDVNRSIALRYDYPQETKQILRSGFWTISKPWDTPGAIPNGRYSWGGRAYFDTVHDAPGSEGVIGCGEACNWEWAWHGEMCSRALLTADAFWNGPAPAAGPELAKFEQAAVNACVRFNERISTGIEYPSWRTGMTPKFFSVDIRAVCTRSHIDDGSAGGMGRSGPKEGVNGFGAAFDFRRIPLGAQTFSGIPFEVIDPVKNNWKSMLVVCTAPKEALIPNTVSSATIPVNRKAASFCILRANLRTVFRAGQTDHYPNLLQPAYVFEYSDGTRCVCDWEIRRHFDDITGQCFYYGNPLRTSVTGFMFSSTRLGHAANTVSGAGANVFINEIVNPFPDKEIRNLLVQLPNPETRDYTFEFHDAIFAVTGVEPVEWDSKYWSQHTKPLLQANATLPADAKKIDGVKFNDNQKHPRVYQCTLAKPVELSGLTFRLFMPWRDNRPMAVRNRHADCKVLVTKDQKQWIEVAAIKGCCGMDGEHILAWQPQSITGVQFVLDCSAYGDEDGADIGLQACELFGKQ